MADLTIVIPYRNGEAYINKLLDSIPVEIPVILMDDLSSQPFRASNRTNLTVMRNAKRGYFTGTVNAGVAQCDTDVLILNQDVEFTGGGWLDLINANRQRYGMIGECIAGRHPAYPQGYIHGTFMFVRRDVIRKIGLMDATLYPLWGSTCEWQLRACRAGFEVLPVKHIPDFIHARGNEAYGSSIKAQLRENADSKGLMIRTPPLISVVIGSHQHGRYLKDAIHSLIGGATSLGVRPPQSLQSFEVIVVDDASTDDTKDVMAELASDWQGIRYIRHPKNLGSAAACNTGIKAANADIIAILDADDMMEPERLERLYWAVVGNPNRVAYDDIQIIREGDYLRDSHGRIKIWPMREYDFDTLLRQNLMHKGLMFPKQAWADAGGYPETMRTGREDWAFNIALGRAGWCGMRVPHAGYLYRREGQNRTLVNTTPEHRRIFTQAIVTLFPELYRGEKPMGCCGSNTNKPLVAQNGAISMSKNQALPGQNGMIQIVYKGLSAGTQPYYGGATRTRYDVGKRRNIVWIASEDWASFDDLYEGTIKAFEVYVPEPVRRPAPVNIDPTPVVQVPDIAEGVAEGLVGVQTTLLGDLDISTMTVADVKALAVDSPTEDIALLLEKEIDGKGRVSLTNYLRELLNA